MYGYYCEYYLLRATECIQAHELEVQVAVSHHVSIWNQTLVLCKTSALSC